MMPLLAAPQDKARIGRRLTQKTYWWTYWSLAVGALLASSCRSRSDQTPQTTQATTSAPTAPSTAGNPQLAWTSYTPASKGHVRDFIRLTHQLTFVAPDSPQKVEPRNTKRQLVYVDLQPEEFAADSFDVAKCPKCGDTSFASDSGRVLARIVNRDRNGDFDRLQLSSRKRQHEYVIWWVETRGDRDWHNWTNHYYKVTEGLKPDTAYEVNRDQPPETPAFLFHPETWTGPTPRLADWDKPVWPNRRAGDHHRARYMDGQSSWITCGSGCCNGR